MAHVGLVLLLLLVQPLANAGSLISNEFDKHFKDASIYLPIGTDWRTLKAQLYAESNLNQFAVSPVGARGLGQFMPKTAEELQQKHPKILKGNFWLPETSIIAAALYMRQLNNFWSSPRPVVDRWLLSTASYNAGAGNIHKAQKKCDMALLYKDIIKCLPQVTGKYSEETITYNKRILRFYSILLLD